MCVCDWCVRVHVCACVCVWRTADFSSAHLVDDHGQGAAHPLHHRHRVAREARSVPAAESGGTRGGEESERAKERAAGLSPGQLPIRLLALLADFDVVVGEDAHLGHRLHGVLGWHLLSHPLTITLFFSLPAPPTL